MNKKNKYWIMHWWYIYYLLDELLHNYAILYIWENLTSSSNIYYHNPIIEDNLELYDKNIKILSQTNSTIVLEVIIFKENINYVTWIYTFIRKK